MFATGKSFHRVRPVIKKKTRLRAGLFKIGEDLLGKGAVGEDPLHRKILPIGRHVQLHASLHGTDVGLLLHVQKIRGQIGRPISQLPQFRIPMDHPMAIVIGTADHNRTLLHNTARSPALTP